MVYNAKPSILFTSGRCYAAKKVKKLYPVHLLMIIYVLLLETVSGALSPIWPWQVLAQSALIQTWIPYRRIYYALNGVSWYLSVAAFTYFCFPYILKCQKHYRKTWDAINSIVVIFLIDCMVCFLLKQSKVSNETIYYVTYIFPLYRLSDFLIGCNLGYVFVHRKKTGNMCKKTSRGTLNEILVLVLFEVEEFLFKYGSVPEEIKYMLFFLPVSVLIVWVFADGYGLISKVGNTHIVAKIASLSGYCFLIHHKIIRTVIALLEKIAHNSPKFLVALISMILSIILAEAYIAVSNHLKRHKKFFERKT